MSFTPHFSCYFCDANIAEGAIPYFGTLGKPMCEPCRLEMQAEIDRKHSLWVAQDREAALLREAREMDLIRNSKLNYHDL
jgi:hypothetical protein